MTEEREEETTMTQEWMEGMFPKSTKLVVQIGDPVIGVPLQGGGQAVRMNGSVTAIEVLLARQGAMAPSRRLTNTEEIEHLLDGLPYPVAHGSTLEGQLRADNMR